MTDDEMAGELDGRDSMDMILGAPKTGPGNNRPVGHWPNDCDNRPVGQGRTATTNHLERIHRKGTRIRVGGNGSPQ